MLLIDLKPSLCEMTIRCSAVSAQFSPMLSESDVNLNGFEIKIDGNMHNNLSLFLTSSSNIEVDQSNILSQFQCFLF